MTKEKRLVSAETLEVKEAEHEKTLRPLLLKDFTGQKNICENLSIFIKAAKNRHEAIDHILFSGPPGLGKTTLARIIANEMGAEFRTTSGPLLSKTGDLAAILTSLSHGDVLFIDEIHRMNSSVEEVLYSAIEDFCLDLVIGEGPGARAMRIDLPHFTLVGATTRSGMISRPLRERFGIPLQLQFYSPEELEKILTRAATFLEVSLTAESGFQIASRSRGTPRIALRLLRRVRDFSHAENSTHIDEILAMSALGKLDIDSSGLDTLDTQYLEALAKHFSGGPCGIDTLCAALSSERDVIEDVVEPFLIQSGFIQKTTKGRVLTPSGWAHSNISPPLQKTTPLFD